MGVLVDDSQFFPGCTDMVRHWQQLGFIARVELPAGVDPVFVEVERKLERARDPSVVSDATSTKEGAELGKRKREA